MQAELHTALHWDERHCRTETAEALSAPFESLASVTASSKGRARLRQPHELYPHESQQTEQGRWCAFALATVSAPKGESGSLSVIFLPFLRARGEVSLMISIKC